MKQITELIEAADSFFNKCHCVDDETASRLDRAISAAEEWAKGKEPVNWHGDYGDCGNCGEKSMYLGVDRNFCHCCGFPIARPK
jgi:ribosomal protein L37E